MASASDFLAKATAKKGNIKGQKKIDRSNMPTRPWESEDQLVSRKHQDDSAYFLEKKVSQKRVERQTIEASSEKKNLEDQLGQIDKEIESEKNREAQGLAQQQDLEIEDTSEARPVRLLLDDGFHAKVFKMFVERELNARQMKIISGIILVQGSSSELIPISNNDWQFLLKSKHVKWVQTEIKRLITDQIVIKVTGQSGLSKSSYGLNFEKI